MKRSHWAILLSVVIFVATAIGMQACGSSSTAAGNVTFKGAGK